MWKRRLELRRGWEALARDLVALPAVAFVGCHLIYDALHRQSNGSLEVLAAPVAVAMLLLRQTVDVVDEAALVEHMETMGLSRAAYCAARALEAAAVGALYACLIAAVSSYLGLFARASFVTLFALMWAFAVSSGALGVLLAALVGQSKTLAVQAAVALQVASAACFFYGGGRGALLLPHYALLYGVDALQLDDSLRHQKGSVEAATAALALDALVFVSLAALLSSWSLRRRTSDSVEHSTEALPAEAVVVTNLRKVLGGQTVVDGVSFAFGEGSVYALLGANGAGKSTTMRILTGGLNSDAAHKSGGATVYGNSIRQDAAKVRALTGACAQDDVLCALLTAREHITLFARIKRAARHEEADGEAEADLLLKQFDMSDRADALASELSGGLWRKVSTCLALCGGSRFVVLDEPTAGMDCLARRAFWGVVECGDRATLLSTHYIDEADAVADRIGILHKGRLVCDGPPHALKRRFGEAHRLVCDVRRGAKAEQLHRLRECLENAGLDADAGAGRRLRHGETLELALPPALLSSGKAAGLLRSLGDGLESFGIESFGLRAPDLGDVFMAVCAEDQGPPAAEAPSGAEGTEPRGLVPVVFRQAQAVAAKRLRAAKRQRLLTATLLLPPVATCVCAQWAAFRDILQLRDADTNDLVTALAVSGSLLLYPAIVAAGVVEEREKKLRAVLRVVGCDGRAYWLGNLVADLLIYAPVALTLAAGPLLFEGHFGKTGGVLFFARLAYLQIFGLFLLSHSYLASTRYNSATACLGGLPGVHVGLVLAPQLCILLIFASKMQPPLPPEALGGGGLILFSPQGAFFLGFSNVLLGSRRAFDGQRRSGGAQGWTTVFGAAFDDTARVCIATLLLQAAASMALTIFLDERLAAPEASEEAAQDVLKCAQGEDGDVVAERVAVFGMRDGALTSPTFEFALVVKGLRHVYASASAPAVDGVSFRVSRGECFGLLGANGAGKSTTLDAIVREILPTKGAVFVNGRCVNASADGPQVTRGRGLGIVAQSNTLWDALSARDHLVLFSRLRQPRNVDGSPADAAVRRILASLDLLRHADKRSAHLSGGMKRKLCVAMALVGDPACCLLDEPSAGLDPLARRTLWRVLRETMEKRSVVLTSHLMEEVEALCGRVAILVRGRLAAIGTIQHLKSRFGAHYTVEIHGTKDIEGVQRLLDRIFGPGAAQRVARPSAATRNAGRASEAPAAPRPGGSETFLVPSGVMARDLGRALAALEAQKEALFDDYAVAQPSLETVFRNTIAHRH
ncbi:P-loop containing nucleoside triphosphate hydrolase protein [Pelagophyceae sp. CCMP2097]|nr:P-loop containing nucleoside triphosphate hydrolase protein [Pelagophyceae sp. CCMP2097]